MPNKEVIRKKIFSLSIASTYNVKGQDIFLHSGLLGTR